MTGTIQIRVDRLSIKIQLQKPSQETMAALREADRITRDPSTKHYHNVEEALKILKK